MKKYILLAAALISLAACDSEDSYIDEPVPARISATIGESALTRASDTEWGKGDKIGVSMSGGRYSNVKYTTENGDGKFDGTTIYFKNKTESVTLTAYYPFSGSEGDTPGLVEASTGVDRQSEAEQLKFDFLFAKNENVSGSSPDVKFSFSHRMSKLTLVFVNGNDGTDVRKITSCVISGLVLDGTFNPATGECASKTGATAADLILTPTVVENTALPSLILFPQPATAVKLKITDSDNQAYECDLKFTGGKLESGNNYFFTIKVKKTELKVSYEIQDWITPGEPTEVEAGSDDSDDSDAGSQS